MTATTQTGVQSGESAGAGDNERVTEPGDYGALNAVYMALLGALLAVASRREDADTDIPIRELVPLGAATFALSKVVAKEKIGTWVREPFVKEGADHRPGSPRGRGMRHAVGELMTCTRCVGAWSALGVVGLRVLSPRAGRVATTVLASSGVNDFLQAGFRYTTESVNAVSS